LPSPHPFRPLTPGNVLVFSASTLTVAALFSILLNQHGSFPTWVNLTLACGAAAVSAWLLDRAIQRASTGIEEFRQDKKALEKIHKNSLSLWTDLATPESPEEPQDHIQTILHDLTNLLHFTTSLLQSRIGVPCAATIKLLIDSPDDTDVPRVHTLLRDPRSGREREAYLPPNDFPYTENTAFKDLLIKPALRGVYAANNLAALAVLEEYSNSNEQWEQFYNATVVHTIHRWNEKQTAIGFLCVDSWHKLKGKKVGQILAPISIEVHDKLQLLCFAQAKIEGYEDLSALRQGFQLGWDCSSGNPKLLNVEHQRLLERAIESLEKIRYHTSEGAAQRSLGGAVVGYSRQRGSTEMPTRPDTLPPSPWRQRRETVKEDVSRLSKERLEELLHAAMPPKDAEGDRTP